MLTTSSQAPPFADLIVPEREVKAKIPPTGSGSYGRAVTGVSEPMVPRGVSNLMVSPGVSSAMVGPGAPPAMGDSRASEVKPVTCPIALPIACALEAPPVPCRPA
mmetsp:Transcript_6777/g.11860  ORF Transcript_6777/g.11860 Transcript_6777/m.11860 type:complete len:105 (-) Transcript_6777:160-474(-)